MKITIFAMPALAIASHLGFMTYEPMNSLCVVYTVVEKPVYINTCFPSSTVATIAGCTTTISSATCIDTIVTESVTLNPHGPTAAHGPVEYTTITTDVLTTVCPTPTIFTYGTKTYTITKATTLTITDCPCIFTRTKHSSEMTTSSSVQNSTQPVPASSTAITSSSNSEAASGSSSSVPAGSSSSVNVTVPSSTISVDISTISQSASTTVLPDSSSVPTDIPTTITIPSSPVSTVTTFSPTPTSNFCGPSGGGSSCDGSPFGACCGSDDTCGTDVAHCGTGCQPGFGLCTPISNDGTCGNGVSCEGSQFGDCCSQFFFCGSTTEFCDAGCQPEFGICDPIPSSTIISFPSSTHIIPSATPSADPCGVTYDSGAIPPNIGNGTLSSIPAPAVYTFIGATYSFGFLDTAPGSAAYAAINPTTPATDRIAYYEIPPSILPPTTSCSSFGYFYHVESGLCVTAAATSNLPTGPKFSGSELLLQPCGLCAGRPDIDQLFCVNGLQGVAERDRPYQCMEFYGDVLDPVPFYETIYGPGPDLDIATVELGPGSCIWLLFP